MAKPLVSQTQNGSAFNSGIPSDTALLFEDLDFPANRSSIRRFAQDNEINKAMLGRIDQLPDQIYDDSEQIVAALQNPENNMDADEAAEMDSNEEPSHLSSQAVDPGEFKQSALESKRPLSDGRDD